MLSIKNTLRFVDDNFYIPTPETDEYKAWEHCNNLLQSWLHANLDHTIKKSILYLRTTSDI